MSCTHLTQLCCVSGSIHWISEHAKCQRHLKLPCMNTMRWKPLQVTCLSHQHCLRSLALTFNPLNTYPSDRSLVDDMIGSDWLLLHLWLEETVHAAFLEVGWCIQLVLQPRKQLWHGFCLSQTIRLNALNFWNYFLKNTKRHCLHLNNLTWFIFSLIVFFPLLPKLLPREH